MSIASTTNRVDYTGNGAVDTYAYTFRIFAKTDLRVTVRNTDDEETTLTVDTDYTVTGVGDSGGGNVVLVNSSQAWLDADGDLKSNYRLTIRRVRSLKQETDIRNQGDFFPETHEDAFDHGVMIDQQQQDEIDRAVLLPETVPTSEFDPTLPSDIAGAESKVPLTNDDGDGWADAADWPTASAISAAQSNATAAAASATAAASSATSASTSATAAAASATAAATSAASVIWNDVVFITFANSPFSITSSHRGKMICVDTSGGAVAITLPQISGLSLSTPFVVGIKKTTTDGNAVTVSRSGTDTIDGLTSKSIAVTDSGAAFIPDTDTSPDEWTAADFGSAGGNLTVDRFSGDGADTTFTLSIDPGTENNTWVYVSGVYQQKDTYSMSGTTLTFSAAPPSGTNNIEVVTGTSLAIGVPGDGTVTPVKLENGTASPGNSKYYGTNDSGTTGFHDFTGGFAGFSSVKTSNYTVTSADKGKCILVNTSGGSFTVTLPTPAANFSVDIKDATGFCGVNPLTIARAGSEDIDDGAGSDYLTTPFECRNYSSDGTDYYRRYYFRGESVAGRGVFGGGDVGSANNTIDYVSIPTTGNATDFGDLSVARYGVGACASSTRGVFAGGNNAASDQNVIDYITIASTGNATDFGDLSTSRYANAGLSNSTRGLFGGGDTGPSNVIDYITIASLGNATDFGDLTVARGRVGGAASTTRGLFGGGSTGPSNVIDYVTIASTGNATDFGDLTVVRQDLSGCANSVRALFGGGSGASNVIDYVTIASTGNATDFGDLTVARDSVAACSNLTRGLFAGGLAYSNIIDYVAIASTGNATDFGDLTVARAHPSGLSNAHGGL